ncbi:MAG: hypothetical protein KKF89_02425 [Nanoarchaeota archaeon]|nr:hypothetical protein [Nanoarchaeota archaeon]MBU1854549.1 hypothetical protein [Nanoarchaeota archaeon]
MKKILVFLTVFLLMAITASAKPTLPVISAVTVTEGSTAIIDITLTEGPDNGSTVWATDLASLTLSSSNDTFARYTWATTIGDAGVYTVKFTVSDGNSSNSGYMTLTVNAQSCSLTLSEVTLGGTSQERELTDSETLTITNSGTNVITGIVLSTNAGSDYNVSFSSTTIASLASGASQTVTLQGYIPDDKDSEKQSIGIITVTGTGCSGQVTKTVNLYMQAENNLEIKDVEVVVNGDDENVDDGDSVDVFPAAEIEMTIELKNTHSDINIEDIEITVEGEDDLDDIDEDDEISRIKDGDKDSVTFKFTIDEDAGDGKYDVVITVEGEDENGAMHRDEWTIEFNLNEEGIIITQAELIPESLRCGDDSFDIKIELTNVGSRDEDDVAIEIEAETLEFEKRISNLEIDEDDEITRTYTVTVPEDLESGVHLIEIRAYMDFDEQTHRKYLYLTVPSGCSPTDDSTNGIVVNPPITEDPETEDVNFVDVGTTTTTTSTSGNVIFGTVWGTVLLVLGNVLLLLIIIILVVKFLIRP